MGTMPEGISKGKMFGKLDAALSSVTRRRKGLQELRNLAPNDPDGLIVLGKKYRLFSDKEAPHFRNHWLKDWWPKAQPLAPLVRQGLITAMEVASGLPGTPRAGKKPLPIACFWVCDPGHEQGHKPSTRESNGPVEIDIAWSRHQVTVILHTPDPPVVVPPPTGAEPLLVVRRQGGKSDPRGNDVVVVRP